MTKFILSIRKDDDDDEDDDHHYHTKISLHITLYNFRKLLVIVEGKLVGQTREKIYGIIIASLRNGQLLRLSLLLLEPSLLFS